MPNTPRFNVPYPSGGVANDFAAALAALGNGFDSIIAGYGEGTVAARPAANVSKGKFYRATDTNTNGGWFASDGTNWVRLTPSPFATWSPTVRVTDGAGNLSSVTASLSGASYLYRLLPGGDVEVSVEASVALHGSQVFCGLLFSTPISSSRTWHISGEAMNDVIRCRVEDAGGTLGGNSIAIFPNGSYAPGSSHVGSWYVDDFGRFVRATGIYPTT